MTEEKNIYLDYLKAYGSHTIAYSSLFDEKMDQFHCQGKGFVSYGSDKNFRFMLGDPVCSEENLEAVIKSFIEDTQKNSLTLVAFQCSLKTAEIFCRYDYHANHMGVETILFLDKFETRGKDMTKVRRWINSAVNAGILVKEEKLSEPRIKTEVQRISDTWLDNKANTEELSLLTRPLVFEDEPGVRFFCGYLNDRIVGFNSFEPMYKNGKPIGYYANICRVENEAPNGTLDLIMQSAREVFKAEGCGYFSFGLSPMSDIKDEHNFHNPLISIMLETNYKYGNTLYSFQGLDFHKKAYHNEKHSERRPVYLITKGALPINQAICTLRYIGILPTKSFMSSLAYLAENMMKGFYEQNKDKLKVSEPEMNTILTNIAKGMSNEEISAASKYNTSIVESIANAFTAVGRQKLPEFQEKLFTQKNLTGIYKNIYAKIEEIVDKDEDSLLVYNIGINTSEEGHFVMMTIELNGNTTISKANFITARIKERIKNAIPDVINVFVEVAPVGQFAYKIGSRK